MTRRVAALMEVRRAHEDAQAPMPVVHSRHAMFCLDCENIFIAGRGANDCPVCASGATTPMSVWLNGQKEKGE